MALFSQLKQLLFDMSNIRSSIGVRKEAQKIELKRNQAEPVLKLFLSRKIQTPV